MNSSGGARPPSPVGDRILVDAAACDPRTAPTALRAHAPVLYAAAGGKVRRGDGSYRVRTEPAISS